jgi:DUF971 family protein
MRLKVDEISCHPTEITLHQISRTLEISFSDNKAFTLPYEYLRVYTPSAEAVGHGPGQETLQLNKQDVIIDSIKPIGNYAIEPQFSDGHNSGIYTWAFLYKLGNEHQTLWASYLDKLNMAGHTRKPT